MIEYLPGPKTVRDIRMECNQCGGFWVDPENVQRIIDERDRLRKSLKRTDELEADDETLKEVREEWVCKEETMAGHMWYLDDKHERPIYFGYNANYYKPGAKLIITAKVEGERDVLRATI